MRLRQLFLNEAYMGDLSAFRNYMRDGEPDHYMFWHLFRDWAADHGYDDLADAWAEDDPSQFDDFPEDVKAEFISYIKNHGIDDMMQHTPHEAPTWAHASLENTHLLPRTTWLVHFTDNAYEIAKDGFKYGVYDMDKLGLTTWYRNDGFTKKHGGYNFAFLADGNDADNGARGKKYGRDAVLFQSSGVLIYHYGDSEKQVVFWGASVDPRSIIRLERLSSHDDWSVKEHPRAKSRRDRAYVYGGDRSFRDCVAWAQQNYRQYAKLITGW